MAEEIEAVCERASGGFTAQVGNTCTMAEEIQAVCERASGGFTAQVGNAYTIHYTP